MRNPIPVPLGDNPYATPYTSVGRELCENLYIEMSGSKTAKAESFFIKIPGLHKLIDGSTTNACRGLLGCSNTRTFGVFGQFVYEIAANWSRTLLFNLNSYSGPVGMTEDGEYLLIVDGVDGWTYKFETGEIVRIDPATDGNEGFPRGATHCTCLDTYFVVNDPRTNRYNWSNAQYGLMTTGGIAGSGGNWNGLNVAMKIAKPDNIIALCDCNNMLWLFGEQSIEVHYDTGSYPGVFARYEGAIIEIGCLARYSVKKYANNVFWIGSDKTGTIGVFSNDGVQPKRISVRGIEQIIQSMSNFSDAIGMTFAENGHAFYLLHFPTGNRTLVYDITTGRWHARAFLYRQDGTTNRWRGHMSTYAYGKNLFGDNASDAIYWSDQEYYVNDNATGTGVNYIKCVKTTPIGFQNGKNIRYLSIQPVFAQGVGLAQDTSEHVGENPSALVAFSDDSGNSWSQERKVHIGKRGNYAFRSRLTTLGSARNRVWRITCTEPVKLIIVALLAEAQVKGF